MLLYTKVVVAMIFFSRDNIIILGRRRVEMWADDSRFYPVDINHDLKKKKM